MFRICSQSFYIKLSVRSGSFFRHNPPYKYIAFRSFHANSRLHMSIKPTRSASSFTFSTKYPRQHKPPVYGGKGKHQSKGKTPKRSGAGLDRNIRLPARLRLDQLKSTFSNTASKSKSSSKSHFGGKYDTDLYNGSKRKSQSRVGAQFKHSNEDQVSNKSTIAKASRSFLGRSKRDQYDEYGNIVNATPQSAGSDPVARFGRKKSNTLPRFGSGRASTKSTPLQRPSTTVIQKTPKPLGAKARAAAALFDRALGPNAPAVMNQQLIKKQTLERRAEHAKKFELIDNLGQGKSSRTIQDMIDTATFEGMNLHPKVLESITQGLKFKAPTPVQAMCIPRFIHSTDEAILCAAETGTGKTAAYLASVMHVLKVEEDKAIAGTLKLAVPFKFASSLPKSDINAKINNDAFRAVEAITTDGDSITSVAGLALIRKIRRPRAIIIVPSRDLVAQVTATAKILSHKAKLRVVGMHSRSDYKAREFALSSAPIDILICTPGMLTSFTESKDIVLTQTSLIVVDEADTLFDTNFQDDLKPIIQSVKTFSKNQGRTCRFLFTTATLPKTLNLAVLDEFPELRRVFTPNLHRTQAKLHQSFLRLDSSTTKPNMLLEVLRRAVLETDRIIIFCNRRSTCNTVSDHLRSKSYDVVTLTSSAEIKNRTKSLEQFLNPELIKEPFEKLEAMYGNEDEKHVVSPSVVEMQVEGLSKPPLGKPMIMVATDIASRGLDTTPVGHVILYDFPQTAIDYLHRVGRTARNGRSGRATSIIAHRDASLAEFISKAVKKRDMLA
ncbi:hypothetical protein RTP6_002959 [Batrachochytrium dendrobatidis]